MVGYDGVGVECTSAILQPRVQDPPVTIFFLFFIKSSASVSKMFLIYLIYEFYFIFRFKVSRFVFLGTPSPVHVFYLNRTTFQRNDRWSQWSRGTVGVCYSAALGSNPACDILKFFSPCQCSNNLKMFL
jgi:hypothetical protein